MDPIRNIITGPLPGGAAPVSEQQALDLKSKIQDALVQIQQATQYNEFFDMQEAAKMETLKAELKGSLVAINIFLATGQWPQGGINGTGTSQNPNGSPLIPRDVAPGWNGDVTVDTNIPSGGGDVQSLVPGAQFQGFVYINDSGNPQNPPRLVFDASATTQKIEAFNHGSDVVYVETYLDGVGHTQQRFWIGRNHATNIQANIIVTAHNVQDHGVTIDFHRAYRIDEHGNVGGYNIFGSDQNDTLIGSQGDDVIRGFKGNDTIRGEGGSDELYGDDGIWQGGVSSAAIRQQLGMRTDLTDGNDTIDGGAGIDQIYGDGGVNYGSETDATTGDTPETKVGIQNNLSSQSTTPATSAWFTTAGADASVGWGNIRNVSPGVVEISETDAAVGINSQLTLQMPDGYDYAYGEEQPSDQSLKITFVKHVDGGSPQTFVVIVKGALRNRTDSLTSPFTLKLLGNGQANIIDFHKVNFGNNNFRAEGAGGDDMILAPNNDLNKYGLSLDDLIGQSNRFSPPEVAGKVDDVIKHDDAAGGTNGVTAVASGNEIHVTRVRTEQEQSDAGWLDHSQTLHINSTGFDRAYVTVDPQNSSNLLVVLVKQSATGGAPSTLVIRIDDYERFRGNSGTTGDLSWLDIGPNAGLGTAADGSGADAHPQQNNGGTSGFIPLLIAQIDGQSESGNIIDAGSGEQDFVFHWKGDTIQNAESEITARYVDPTTIQQPVQPPAPDPTQDPPPTDPPPRS